MKLQKRRH